MNLEQLWGSAFLIGLLATCWQQLRTLLVRLCRLLIVQVDVDTELQPAVRRYCWEQASRVTFGMRLYGALSEYVRPLRRQQLVVYEDVGTDPVVMWRGPWPLLCSLMFLNQTPNRLRLTCLRGTWDIEAVLVAAIELLNRSRHSGSSGQSRYRARRLFGYTKHMRGHGDSRLQAGDSPAPQVRARDDTALSEGIYRPLQWSVGQLGAATANGSPWAALAYPPEVLELVEEAKHWLQSREWYQEKQIPWRRGWLLHGIPGTGKTSLVRAIAQDLDLPIFMFDLTGMSNEEFVRHWDDVLGQTPCLVLLEDLDATFHGRENILGGNGGGLTFDCVLNCLSGVVQADGVFTVVTTNCIDKLDVAMGKAGDAGEPASRPGRVDRVVELLQLTEACRQQIAERVLSDCPALVSGMVRLGDGDTAAQFSDRCARVALKHHWEKGV